MINRKSRANPQRNIIPGLRAKCRDGRHSECYSLHCTCSCHKIVDNPPAFVPPEMKKEELRQPQRLISPLKDIIDISSEVVDTSTDVLRDERNIGLARTVKGAIGELHVAAWLLQHGYEPYFPAPGRNAKDDMLAVHIATGKVCRVQVKTTEGNGEIPVAFSKGQVLAKVFLFYAPDDSGGAA